MYITLFFIVIINELHSVNLASIHDHLDLGLTKSMPVMTPGSTISVIADIYKSKCGSVQKPGYSCEDQTSEQPLQKLFVEGTTWKPKEDLESTNTIGPPDTLFDLITNKKDETAFDRPSSVVMFQKPSASQRLPVYGGEGLTRSFWSRVLAPSVQSQNIVSQSMLPSRKASPIHFQGIASQSIVPQNTMLRDEALRSVASQDVTIGSLPSSSVVNSSQILRRVNLNTTSSHGVLTKNKTLRSYSIKSRREATLRHGQNNRLKVQMLNKLIRTKSTYPPWPQGSTPSKEPEPITLEMCGIAKCLKLQWKSVEKAVKLQLDKMPTVPQPDLMDFMADPLDVVIDA